MQSLALKFFALMDTDTYQKVRLAIVCGMAGMLFSTLIIQAPVLWKMPQSIIPIADAQDRAERIAAGLADNTARIKIAEATISSLQAEQAVLVASNVQLASKIDFYAEQQKSMNTMIYSILSGLSILVFKEAIALLKRWTQNTKV